MGVTQAESLLWSSSSPGVSQHSYSHLAREGVEHGAARSCLELPTIYWASPSLGHILGIGNVTVTWEQSVLALRSQKEEHMMVRGNPGWGASRQDLEGVLN